MCKSTNVQWCLVDTLILLKHDLSIKAIVLSTSITCLIIWKNLCQLDLWLEPLELYKADQLHGTALMIGYCSRLFQSLTVSSSWEIWKHVWSICDLETLSHDSFKNDDCVFHKMIWTCFNCVNGINTFCKIKVEIVTDGSVNEMIRSEKSPVSETSVWSGLCDICHENGSSGDGVNYGDCHCHFDGDCCCCFDDGYGCSDAWNREYDHVRWSNPVKCWHFHRMYQDHEVTDSHSNWLVLRPPVVMD